MTIFGGKFTAPEQLSNAFDSDKIKFYPIEATDHEPAKDSKILSTREIKEPLKYTNVNQKCKNNPFKPELNYEFDVDALKESKTIYSKKFIEETANANHLFLQSKKIVLFKTEMCRSFTELGVCKYGESCQFCHDPSELRNVKRHPKYKTEICKTFWNVGSCPYGSRCCFIHKEKDVIKAKNDSNDELNISIQNSNKKEFENLNYLKDCFVSELLLSVNKVIDEETQNISSSEKFEFKESDIQFNKIGEQLDKEYLIDELSNKISSFKIAEQITIKDYDNKNNKETELFKESKNGKCSPVQDKIIKIQGMFHNIKEINYLRISKGLPGEYNSKKKLYVSKVIREQQETKKSATEKPQEENNVYIPVLGDTFASFVNARAVEVNKFHPCVAPREGEIFYYLTNEVEQFPQWKNEMEIWTEKPVYFITNQESDRKHKKNECK